MSRGVFLDPLKTPANTGFPGTVDGLLRFIAQFMAVKGLDDIIGIQIQESKPANTDLPWLATDSTGKPLGLFLFHNSIWTSVEHEKGDLKYQFLTGLVHPHWRITDSTINPIPVNGVAIPNITDRGLLPAAAGGKYNVGDTGGADDLSLVLANIPAHNHTLNLSGTAAAAGSHTHNGRTDKGAGAEFPRAAGFGGGLWQNADAAGVHTHAVTVSGTSDNTGSGTTFDNRSLYFGARLLIYVGVE